MNYTLKFDLNQIPDYAHQYLQKEKDNDAAVLSYKDEICKRGYLTKADLQRVAYWKSPRSAGHVCNNADDYVKKVSHIVFHTENERLRIESLTLLDGVSWPTASAIMHLYHADHYPILDFRALWSLSLAPPSQYNFCFWWHYTEICRSLAQKGNTDMRTLDRALWQYSKEQQGKG